MRKKLVAGPAVSASSSSGGIGHSAVPARQQIGIRLALTSASMVADGTWYLQTKQDAVEKDP